jgi:hypothetical protein
MTGVFPSHPPDQFLDLFRQTRPAARPAADWAYRQLDTLTDVQLLSGKILTHPHFETVHNTKQGQIQHFGPGSVLSIGKRFARRRDAFVPGPPRAAKIAEGGSQ